MIISTKRLIIYPASDDELRRIIAEEPSPELREAYGQMLEGSVTHPDKREWYVIWNIELNDGSKTVVGHMSFMGLEEDGILELGYGTNDGYEGHGYMTEAVSAVVRWASERDGVRRIEAETAPENAASQRVLEKSGFAPNGRMGEEGPRFVWQGL